MLVLAGWMLVSGINSLGQQSFDSGGGGPAAALGAQVPSGEDAGESTEIATRADAQWLAEVAAATGIPERALAAYAGADLLVTQEFGCRVGWNTLAGIGYVESHHGTLFGGVITADGSTSESIIGIPLDGTNNTIAIADTDDGILDGDTEWDRAVGPLQFIPETWEIWGEDGNGDGVADPHQIDDAALTAALYLCDAQGTLEGSENWISAIRSYNNMDAYQQQVAETASYYAEAERALSE